MGAVYQVMLGISFLAKLVILGMVGQVFRVVGVVGYLTADIMHILGMAGQVFILFWLARCLFRLAVAQVRLSICSLSLVRVVGVLGHFMVSMAGQVFITAGFSGVLVAKVIYRVFNLILVVWDIMVVFMVIFCGWGV